MVAPGGEGTGDVKTVRQRLIDTLVPPRGPAPISEKEAGALLDSLQGDGRWPGIDYASQQRASWAPGNHVRRALELARAYRAPGHALRGRPEVRDKILLALRWWIANDLQCPNWWWNEIGVPEPLAKTLLLLGDEFPADLAPGVSKILARAERKDMTGQNTLWVCGVRLMRGCIEDSPERVGAVFKRIADEVKITTGEGVQPDFSFHQHGALLYSGGYGRGYAISGPHLARLAAGTRWAFPAEKIDILAGYLLDGEQWMVMGDRFDLSCVGREIVRKGHSAAPLSKACEDLLALGASRAEEFRALAARLRGKSGAPPLAGNRHFWRSDFLVHRRPTWYASVRMFSTRVYNSELVNGEGKKSHHLADGMTLVLRDGREFDGVPPVWDWKRLPGTTCEQGPLPDPVKQRGQTAFVGAASDGRYGACAMDLVRGTLAAKKAWFFFDDCFMALGAGITSTSDHPVWTSIDQRPLAGDVTVRRPGAEPVPVERGEGAVERIAQVHHGGVGYFVMEPGRMRLRIAAQTGSYREISDPASSQPMQRDVLSLWIDHGVRPAAAEYCYGVLPDVRAGAVGAVGPLSNTPDLQAVRHPMEGTIGAVFWKAGTLAVPRAPSLEKVQRQGGGPPKPVPIDFTVRVSQPCILLMREEAGGVRLAVADPTQRVAALAVEVGRPLEGEGCTWSPEAKTSTIRFVLPGGAEAGRSVVRELTCR